jgi:GntR family transcriptional repressor for pyruvate dehydrogenase complex
LLLRRQGGGTFVQSSLWQSFSDPLVELLSDHPESQFDLLETRHALEGIAAYYAALRSTDEDRERIRELHQAIERAQQSGDLDAESAPSSSIKLPSPKRHTMWCCSICYAAWSRCWPRTFVRILNCCMPVGRCSRWSATIALDIRGDNGREPEQAREASHRHLAFIEEILLDRSREQIVVNAHCVVYSNERIKRRFFLERGN